MQIFKIDTDGNAAVKDIKGDLKADPITTLLITEKKNPMKVLTALVGNLIFVSHDDEGNTLGLTNEQIDFIKAHLKQLCYFSPNGKMNMAHTFWF